MSRIIPGRPRSIHATIPGGIRVIILARRHWLVIPFLCVWLVGWAFGEVTAIRSLLNGPAPGPTSFLFVWLAFWTLGGALAVTLVAWSVAGREVVSVASGTLALRREAFGIGRTWEYDAKEVRNLRATPPHINPFGFSASFQFWGLGGGPIAFDYGARTNRFGAGIDEAEATAIVAAIRERLPSGE